MFHDSVKKTQCEDPTPTDKMSYEPISFLPLLSKFSNESGYHVVLSALYQKSSILVMTDMTRLNPDSYLPKKLFYLLQ